MGTGIARSEALEHRDRSYAVKSIFLTLQGEGINTGKAAVFCRFTGCNLWSGHEPQRAAALCRFCDTDFTGTDGEGGGSYRGPAALAQAIVERWPTSDAQPFVVLTGGEPALQLDPGLIAALHSHRAVVAVETNGTLPLPSGLDWVCVSPKAGGRLVQRSGDELKVVWPQSGLDLDALESLPFEYRILQPMDGPDYERNLEEAVVVCTSRPQWRLGLQMHKYVGIP
jgi:7-carboxy-7-deazaguanine synthase